MADSAPTRKTYREAVPDARHAAEGVAVVASYQTMPETDRPFAVRGVTFTAKTEHHVAIRLSRDEANKLVADFISFGARPAS